MNLAVDGTFYFGVERAALEKKGIVVHARGRDGETQMTLVTAAFPTTRMAGDTSAAGHHSSRWSNSTSAASLGRRPRAP